jgi:hypothetical protein
MEYFQRKRYPRKDNAKGDAGKIRAIVAAAHGKGQGLLLTVEELSADDYEDHRQDLEEKYWAAHGRNPFADRYAMWY